MIKSRAIRIIWIILGTLLICTLFIKLISSREYVAMGKLTAEDIITISANNGILTLNKDTFIINNIKVSISDGNKHIKEYLEKPGMVYIVYSDINGGGESKIENRVTLRALGNIEENGEILVRTTRNKEHLSCSTHGLKIDIEQLKIDATSEEFYTRKLAERVKNSIVELNEQPNKYIELNDLQSSKLLEYAVQDENWRIQFEDNYSFDLAIDKYNKIRIMTKQGEIKESADSIFIITKSKYIEV